MDNILGKLITRFEHIRENLIRLINNDAEADGQAILLVDIQLKKAFDAIMSADNLTPAQYQARIHFLTDRISDIQESESITQLTTKILDDVSNLSRNRTKLLPASRSNVIPFKGSGVDAARYNVNESNAGLHKASQIKSDYLEQAVNSISDAFILYDSNGNLIFYNEIHLDFFPHLADLYRSGAKQEEIWHHHAVKIRELDPSIDVENYVKMRKKQSCKPRPDYERQLIDGRWVATRERFLTDGGMVSIRTDITAQKLLMSDGLNLAT